MWGGKCACLVSRDDFFRVFLPCGIRLDCLSNKLRQPPYYKTRSNQARTITRAGTLKNKQESLGEYVLVLLLKCFTSCEVRIHNETSSLYNIPIPPTTTIDD
ncbi:unnamed protein product [Prunus armeniaca]